MDDVALEHRLTRIETKLDTMIELQRVANGRVGKLEQNQLLFGLPTEWISWKNAVDNFIRTETLKTAAEEGAEQGRAKLRTDDMRKLGLIVALLQAVGGAVVYGLIKFL